VRVLATFDVPDGTDPWEVAIELDYKLAAVFGDVDSTVYATEADYLADLAALYHLKESR
jgi:hypothetical protein